MSLFLCEQISKEKYNVSGLLSSIFSELLIVLMIV